MSICEVRHLEVVSAEVDRIFETIPEGGVARLALILMLEQEKSLRAYLAVVSANIIEPPIVTSEWSLCAFVLGDPELMGSESLLHDLAEILIVLVNVCFESLHVFKLSGLGVALVSINCNCQVFVQDSAIGKSNQIQKIVLY